jgi:hypothetical protein
LEQKEIYLKRQIKQMGRFSSSAGKMSANKEIDRLVKYLIENFPNEIDKVDSVNDEIVVDVAIRLLDRFKIIHTNLRRYQT